MSDACAQADEKTKEMNNKKTEAKNIDTTIRQIAEQKTEVDNTNIKNMVEKKISLKQEEADLAEEIPKLKSECEKQKAAAEAIKKAQDAEAAKKAQDAEAAKHVAAEKNFDAKLKTLKKEAEDKKNTKGVSNWQKASQAYTTLSNLNKGSQIYTKLFDSYKKKIMI
jgi:hypothetical protein